MTGIKFKTRSKNHSVNAAIPQSMCSLLVNPQNITLIDFNVIVWYMVWVKLSQIVG